MPRCSYSQAPDALDAKSRHLLEHLSRGGAYARHDPFDESRLTLVAASRGVAGPAGFAPMGAAATLIDRGLAAWAQGGQGSATRLVPTRTGLATAARLKAKAQGQDPYATQHRALRAVAVGAGETRAVVTLNDAESPLAWLHRRRGRDGQLLIGATAFAAGERLRRDLTIANMAPSATMRWDAVPAARGAGQGASGCPTDAMVAEPQRVTRAMQSVGPEFAGLLVDVCGFLKGMEQVERGWPARSAKIVLDLALARLAARYGLNAQARRPDRSRGVRSWQPSPATE